MAGRILLLLCVSLAVLPSQARPAPSNDEPSREEYRALYANSVFLGEMASRCAFPKQLTDVVDAYKQELDPIRTMLNPGEKFALLREVDAAIAQNFKTAEAKADSCRKVQAVVEKAAASAE